MNTDCLLGFIKRGARRARRVAVIAYTIAIGLLSAPSWPSDAPATHVDGSFIAHNPGDTSWPSVGHDYSESRFSRLARIDASNVQGLGLVWSFDLQSSRGVESTPLVVDGVMYVTAPWSVVFALDAATGALKWTFDPKVAHADGYKACCDVVNRGVAVYKGRVYVGAVDGRLIALDAESGTTLWQRDTIIDHTRSYTITGAPRIYKGNVVIGNGGGEYGVRGYVTAYDWKTGRQSWRFFTVPGDPSKPFEDEAQAQAAMTWDPSGKYWESGGGGTVWNAMAYDPELNLIYVGTGNGTPWAARARSPKGGDNLYTCSIVAINASTGKYVWHYQETPADNWDSGAEQDLILVDLTIDGRQRKTVIQASKNGFFFVIDRTNGQFISARNFGPVNWASGYDAKGRPIELPGVRVSDRPYDIVPGPYGGHNWQSMSWNPTLGLAYIPAQNVPVTLADDRNWKGYNSNQPGLTMSNIGWNAAESVNPVAPTSKAYGRLVAWDPVHQKEVWGVDHVGPWNGGTLTTAGNLVFQGTSDGHLVAYNAQTGQQLWESPTGTGVVAAPMTYELAGQQYISIAVGWGGVYGLLERSTERNTPGAVYTFALGGKAKLPAFVQYQMTNLVSGVPYKPEDVEPGKEIYISSCAFCHGVPGVDKGGAIPNLGYVPAAVISNLGAIVLTGAMTDRGMPNFNGKLSARDVEQLQAFIQGTADAIRPKAN